MEVFMNSNQTKAETKSFNKPEEIRTFPKGKVELITIGGAVYRPCNI